MSRRGRAKTLVIDANGSVWHEFAADSVLLGLLRLPGYDWIPQRLRSLPVIRNLKRRYEALGYVNDWREALQRHPDLDVQLCDVTNLVDLARELRRIERYDLVVLLHTVVGDSMTLPLRIASHLCRRRGPLVSFVGNEYDLMGEKSEFLRRAEVEFAATQLPLEAGQWVYAECPGTTVLEMPHALNPEIYQPGPEERALDLGFVGSYYPLFIGDDERTRLVVAVAEQALVRGLRVDVHEAKTTRERWAAFLMSTHGTMGGEAGTYYLDRRGEIMAAAKAWLAAHPDAALAELHAAVFAEPNVDYVSGKAITSRHFEAIGTRTCQILLEGHYNGILRPGEHYIPVANDLSDVDEALDAFLDTRRRAAVVERAYELALSGHTYAHRADALVRAVL